MILRLKRTCILLCSIAFAAAFCSKDPRIAIAASGGGMRHTIIDSDPDLGGPDGRAWKESEDRKDHDRTLAITLTVICFSGLVFLLVFAAVKLAIPKQPPKQHPKLPDCPRSGEP